MLKELNYSRHRSFNFKKGKTLLPTGTENLLFQSNQILSHPKFFFFILKPFVFTSSMLVNCYSPGQMW